MNISPSSVSTPQLIRTRGCELRAAKQGGIMILIALIALVALTLGGVAFMRSVDTGSLMAGNLAFSRASVAFSDMGMEAARTQLLAISGATCGTASCSESDQPNVGGTQQTNYWANWQVPGFDYQSEAAWAAATEITSPLSGFRVRYIIHRMCANAGSVTGNSCVLDPAPIAVGGGINKGGVDYGNVIDPGSAAASSPLPYYRVTLRVDGPRNSITYVQVWMV